MINTVAMDLFAEVISRLEREGLRGGNFIAFTHPAVAELLEAREEIERLRAELRQERAWRVAQERGLAAKAWLLIEGLWIRKQIHILGLENAS